MPAPTLATDRLRLRMDVDQKNAAYDAIRATTPVVWRSTDIVFEAGLFFNGEVVDVSNLASITLEIKAPGSNNAAPDPATAPLASKTVSTFDNTLASATWTDLTKQHASIGFTAEEMNFSLGGRQYQWLVVSLLTTSGKVLTAAAGLIDIREDGYNSAGTAPVLDGSAYTKAESNALYLPAAADGALSKHGSAALSSGAQAGSVVFATAFSGVPRRLYATVEMPNGAGGVLFASTHTITAAGFSYLLSADAPASGYKLHWHAIL